VLDVQTSKANYLFDNKLQSLINKLKDSVVGFINWWLRQPLWANYIQPFNIKINLILLNQQQLLLLQQLRFGVAGVLVKLRKQIKIKIAKKLKLNWMEYRWLLGKWFTSIFTINLKMPFRCEHWHKCQCSTFQ